MNNILITGAASGIGRETALFFARKGWYVGIVDIDEAGLESLQKEIGTENSYLRKMDVTDPEEVEKTFDGFTGQTDGTMDVLFNNAGIGIFGRFEEVPLEKSLQTVDVNLKGVLNCTFHALKHLKRSANPTIVNMASASAAYGIPDLAAYSSTKHAVCAVTESLDLELEPHGITVCDVIAPYVQTPLLDAGKNVYSIEKMGINIQPSAIAEIVWKAAHGKKLHWKAGGTTYFLFFLFWLMPFLRRRIVKNLTIRPEGK
ncbi:MAG: SDR family oxidoreductase [Proteobacteria bacterium]|nr:SDR family oxidoreductase [Pseudomonadota bacterium]